MRSNLKTLTLVTLLGVVSSTALCAQTTAFTYQGQLIDGGGPAQGLYDLGFRVYDAPTDGNLQGIGLGFNAWPVTNGLFTVELDFGTNVFTGQPLWLQIEVQTNGTSSWNQLSPRQQLMPAPYAIYSATAATAASAATAMTATAANSSSWADDAGSTPWGGLTSVPVGFLDGVDDDTTYSVGVGMSLAGTVFSLDSIYTDGRYWQQGGNAGATAGTHYLGTTDNQPLELKVNGQRVLRLEPGTNATPNVLGGSEMNWLQPGVYGATISGGGGDYYGTPYPNVVQSEFATVGGGGANTIQPEAESATITGGLNNHIYEYAYYSSVGGGLGNLIKNGARGATVGGGEYNENSAGNGTIGGGWDNRAAGDSSTVGGGSHNAATNDYATVAGGRDNVAAGSDSFAAGRRAQALHEGTFVWADSADADFTSTLSNQFLVRATGGVGIGTPSPAKALDIVDGSGAGGQGGNIHLGTVVANGDPRLIHFGDFQANGLGYVYLGENGQDDTLELRAARFFFKDGAVGIGVTNPAARLHVESGASQTARLRLGTVDGGDWDFEVPSAVEPSLNFARAGSTAMSVSYFGTVTATAFNPTSDRHAKENFTEVNPRDVLERVAALPISKWNFKHDTGVEHVGPMAQDFHAAFALGTDDRHIATVDADGVALAAIQGLNRKVEDRSQIAEASIEELKAENEQLRLRLEKLEQWFNDNLDGGE